MLIIYSLYLQFITEATIFFILSGNNTIQSFFSYYHRDRLLTRLNPTNIHKSILEIIHLNMASARLIDQRACTYINHAAKNPNKPNKIHI
jgi:hypothetical protein